MPLEPARRRFRMFAVLAAVVALPFLAACNDSEEDDDDDDDDGMGRPHTVLMISQ